MLIQLRWIAVLGQVATIGAVHFLLGVTLPLPSLLAVVLFLVALNGISLLRYRTLEATTNGALFLELLLDVGALTIQLYLSGGASNPFIALYLLQVMLAAVLLETWATWALVAVTTAGFIGLTRFNRPLVLPHRHEGDLLNLHVQGMFISYALAAALIVIFVTRIGRNLREQDARLAALRQRSIEEELVVRMGLLASGAAHELGTPLGTLSVIVNDWQRMPVLQEDPDLAEDLGEMAEQLVRCKEIVSRILTSSGEMRGEGAGPTTIAHFFDSLIEHWRDLRHPVAMDYRNDFVPDRAIVSDIVLAQGIANILDNALEASPDWIGVKLRRDGEMIVLEVRDRGPGFAEPILSQFGKPYQTTRPRPGGGLGLFLLVNVVRKLGGSVTVENAPTGGARVAVRLPLASLAMEATDGG